MNLPLPWCRLALAMSMALSCCTLFDRVAHAAETPMPAVADVRFPKDLHDFEQMFEQVKTWGRWGADDQLGAANWITDDKRKQALQLAKLGRPVSLSHALLTQPAADNPIPFEHTMDASFTADAYKLSYHGLVSSHLDALCHIPHQGKTYNGYASAEVNTAAGCTKLGVQNLKN